jgi:hypothetical protein
MLRDILVLPVELSMMIMVCWRMIWRVFLYQVQPLKMVIYIFSKKNIELL